MDPSHMVRHVRARRALSLLLVLLVASTAGCAHRRRSMRPVYLAPAPVVSAPCQGADCPPAATVPLGTPTVEPSTVAPLDVPLSSSPAPAASPSYNYSPPPVTGPSLPGLSDEPSLDLEPAPRESSKVSPSRGGTGTGSSSGTGSGSSSVPRATPGPGASSRDADGRIGKAGQALPARTRRAALRAEVLPFVNDPGDLFAPPKADRPWKYIVLHHSASDAGGYAAIDREHRKRLGWDGCGYHFVIGNGTDTADGLIEVAQRWSSQKHGVHCRDGKHPDVNEYGIGICLVGDLESSPPTPRQIEAAKALVAYLSDRYAIPAAHTDTHAHLAASDTSCPGRHFPKQAILGRDGLVQR